MESKNSGSAYIRVLATKEDSGRGLCDKCTPKLGNRRYGKDNQDEKMAEEAARKLANVSRYPKRTRSLFMENYKAIKRGNHKLNENHRTFQKLCLVYLLVLY